MPVGHEVPATVSKNGTKYQLHEEFLTDADDFSYRSNTDVDSEEYSTFAEIDVPKGEIEILGQGLEADQDRAVGRLYSNIQNSTPSSITGRLRLAVLNSQNRVVHIFGTWHTSAINDGQNDRSARRPFPIRYPGNIEFVGHPYKLALMFRTDSGTETISSGNTTVEMDGYRGERMN
ncbi:hypothetical protein BRC81_00205 [Halobacteriales archaeon QS_1_68_20]|nr:MAG: hypothetical protein BRC81_00205 [Halobacteriales archaeon QS_1_68_20]